MKNPFKKWGRSPELDWRIMFTVFLILLGLSILGSLALFYTMGSSGAPPDDIGSEVLNQAALHRAALFYDEKSASFDQIKATPEITPDPSK